MPPLTPLLRPDRFFAEAEFHVLRLLAVAIVLTFSVPVAVSGLGWIVTERVDGTITVDNPNRPSESYCENAPPIADAGCDAPARIEQDVDVSIQRAVDDLLSATILAVPIALLVNGGILHAGSWLLNGEDSEDGEGGDDGEGGEGDEGGAAESFAVALWGMAPAVVPLGVLLLVVYATFDPTTVTPETDPGAFADHLWAEFRTAFRVAPFVSAAAALWSGIIWRFGLVDMRGLSGGEATGLAGALALLSVLVTML